MSPEDYYKCPICARHHKKDRMSWHHLLPSIKGGEKGEPSVYLCQTCHDVIHYCHDNDQLYFIYNTLEKILTSPDVIKMVNLYKYKADDKVFKIRKLLKKMKGEADDRRISQKN